MTEVPMNFAILTAVSSPDQAKKDKISLELQENTARQHAASHGWRETAGPYVIPGESRNIYINLRDAETTIPQLREMLDAARRGEFDVLCIYDFSRLRELLDPISRALAAYSVQVYSTAQPVAPVPAEKFRQIRKISGTSSIVQTVSALTSRSEMDTMTRRLRGGVEGRIPKGLHPSGRVPYGYKHAPVSVSTDERNEYPYVIDPPHAAVLVMIKDLYLQGQAVAQIIDYLRENQIPSPRGHAGWSDYAVRYLLRNPFYAGEVGLGYHRKIRDPRENAVKQVLGDPALVSRNQGQHEALWDLETRREILAEFSRRTKRYKGRKTYRLSLVLTCPLHNRPLYVHYLRGRRDDDHRVWYCPAGEKDHWHLCVKDSDLLRRIAEQLVKDLSDIEKLISSPKNEIQTDLFASAVTDLLARRNRLTDALETGNLAATTYAERVASIDARLREIRAEIAKQEVALLQVGQRVRTLTALGENLASTPNFIEQADPQEVNTQIRGVLQRILVYSESELELVYW